jgi:transporter family-2 protein
MMAAYIGLAALAGALLPLQALINARMGEELNGPLMGTLVNFVVGTIAVAATLAVLRTPVPAAAQMGAAPWWAWLGGLMGAFFVLTATLTIHKLGAAGLSAVVIAGQLLSALLLDHFGLLGAGHGLSASRLAGAAFLLIGVYLILRPGA